MSDELFEKMKKVTTIFIEERQRFDSLPKREQCLELAENLIEQYYSCDYENEGFEQNVINIIETLETRCGSLEDGMVSNCLSAERDVMFWLVENGYAKMVGKPYGRSCMIISNEFELGQCSKCPIEDFKAVIEMRDGICEDCYERREEE